MPDIDGLTGAFLAAHPRAAAQELERVPLASVVALLDGVPARVAAPVLAAMLPGRAAAALQGLDRDAAAGVLAALPPTTAASVLRHVAGGARLALLECLPATTQLTCRTLLRYPADAVGTLVDPAAPVLAGEDTVADAVDALRQRAEAAPGVFLIDDEQRPRGWVPAGALFPAAPELRLAALAGPVASLPALMPVAAALAGPDLDAAPVAAVVGNDGRWIGAVTLVVLRQAHAGAGRGVARPESGTAELVARVYWDAVSALAGAMVGSLLPANRGPAP